MLRKNDPHSGQSVLLKNAEGLEIAVLEVESVFRPDKTNEAHHVYGTTSLEHPGVQELCFDRHALCIGGKIHGLALPEHKMQCDPPAVVRQMLLKDEPSAFFLISRSTPTANAEGARADLKGTLKAPASSRDHSRWLPLDPIVPGI